MAASAGGHEERVAEVVPDGAPVAGRDGSEPVAAGAPAVGGREHERHGAEPEEPLGSGGEHRRRRPRYLVM